MFCSVTDTSSVVLSLNLLFSSWIFYPDFYFLWNISHFYETIYFKLLFKDQLSVLSKMLIGCWSCLSLYLPVAALKYKCIQAAAAKSSRGGKGGNYCLVNWLVTFLIHNVKLLMNENHALKNSLPTAEDSSCRLRKMEREKWSESHFKD